MEKLSKDADDASKNNLTVTSFPITSVTAKEVEGEAGICSGGARRNNSKSIHSIERRGLERR